MTTNTITHGREAVRNKGFGASLLRLITGYVAKDRAARQLAQLDDRLLADIGVKRSEINRMIWGN